MASSVSDVSVLRTADQRDAYLKGLVQIAQAAVPESLALAEVRSRAASFLNEQTFPSIRQEDWRFTDLSAMLGIDFATAGEASVTEADIAALRLPETTGAQVVVVNGRVSRELSQLGGLPEGAVVGSLGDRPELQSQLADRLAQASGNHEVFTALNTVGFTDAVVVWLPRNQVVETPIQIIYLSQAQDDALLVQPRCLVVAESGSALTLVEDFWGESTATHFTNAVTELWLDANAQVTHSRIEREGAGTFHIGKTVVTQARDSQYIGVAAGFGAKLARHNWEIYQTGEQTTTRIYGLGAISATQHADTHSLVALSHPHGIVEQEHKAIVDGKAHSVFNGRMAVAQKAQLTNASQLNRNLLLSDTARVDTKPQLEIVADNVKCAHGATVSQLQSDEIFYLQSRGISAPQAQRLLIYAFAMEILDKITVETLRSRLAEAIAQWP
ncbi:Fe-S cluster assembly protein SufD [Phormidium tenue]|uniref:Fe-S cluster assembly protein SufD n=1 Tax=Phormidium tenue NIES-30 TaxID=549789 RepID=A0A1U7J3G1_9CYAN|nr:Fe-S cluster assembly protein SufD [Phormidium tenue]MBD2233337.1 Fe-S cluster assembly protein SufD [Phormidium tenue FACHB-1052]OKH46801.1 Fe-S cluster assembly protein SufD [Phormidium tenue NIES-30]